MALLCGLLIVGTLYVLLDVMYCHVLPFSRVAGSAHVASDAVESIFGRSGAAWLTVAMGISALATLHAVVLSESRVTYALARAGLFFAFAARVQPRHRSPEGALLFVGTLGALIALTGTFEELVSLYIFAIWIFFALGALALIRLRTTEPGSAASVSRMGLSLDAASVPRRRTRAHDQSVAGPTHPLVCWLGSHPGRPALLLRVASEEPRVAFGARL